MDIDRNINLPLYGATNAIYINNFSSEIYTNYINVYSVSANNAGNWIFNLDSGEYYYLHVFNEVKSDNSLCLCTLFGDSKFYPITTYYAQSPLNTTGTYTAIPFHFYLDRPTTINLHIRNPNSSPMNINSLIEIKKKVK